MQNSPPRTAEEYILSNISFRVIQKHLYKISKEKIEQFSRNRKIHL